MEEELNNLVTKSEDTAEATVAEEKAVEGKSEYVAPTEEEYKKAIQSAASKAKYAILQEMGVKSVDEFKNKYSEYDSAIKENKSLQDKIKEQEVLIGKQQEDLVLEKLQVSDEFRSDLITLAKAKVSDTVDFKSACEEVLQKNPNWKAVSDPVKLGTEKSESKTTSAEDVLSKKYKWLK